MNEAISKMLVQRACTTSEDYKNALKEIIQEIVLLALSRAKFHEHAAFYGGTALRLFYGLDRFSEDIDFSLLHPDPGFGLGGYTSFVKDELTLYGFEAEVTHRQKGHERTVESAFVKATTLWHLLHVAAIGHPRSGVHREGLLKVKFEVDIDPPVGAGYEVQFLYQPLPFSVKLYDPPSLFAGKMHAFLFRNLSGARVKGRDLYDVVWLAGRDIAVNRNHLEARMRQTGHLGEEERLTEQSFRERFRERVARLDLDIAREDVRGFLVDSRATDVWSPALLQDVAGRIWLV